MQEVLVVLSLNPLLFEAPKHAQLNIIYVVLKIIMYLLPPNLLWSITKILTNAPKYAFYNDKLERRRRNVLTR